MLRILTDDVHATPAPYKAALGATLSNRRTDFHSWNSFRARGSGKRLIIKAKLSGVHGVIEDGALGRCEDKWPFFGDGYGVLKVCGARAVARDSRSQSLDRSE